MIALISSVPEEGKLVARQLKKKSVIAGRPLYRGRMQDKDVVYAISGMGKTNAAHAATLLLVRFRPDMIILFGAGGAYPSSGLKVGDIAVAEKEVYGDEGVLTVRGFRDTGLIGIPLAKKGGRKYFSEFPLKAKLLATAVRSFGLIADDLMPGTRMKAGTFITVSTCTGTRKKALELQKRFGAICENMEGASVAHVCILHGSPMAEIRGISNIVEDRDRERWDIRLAAENCQRVVMELLKRL